MKPSLIAELACGERFQIGLQFPQGQAAVAQPVLQVRSQFGEGLFVTKGNKKGIIAESSLSFWRKTDVALANPFEKPWCTASGGNIGRHQSQHAAEPCTATGLRDRLQQVEQFGVVFRVCGIAGSAGII